MVQTIKFSAFPSSGNLENNDITVGLSGGANVRFNNPWTFLPSGTTAQRPTPSSANYYLLRLNTDTKLYEYYNNATSAWVQLSTSSAILLNWTTVTTNTTMVANNGYFTNSASTLQLTLPSAAAFGTQISISGIGSGSGLWRILTGTGQSVVIGTATASTSVTSNHYSDSINLICSVANTVWTAVGGPQSRGLTIV